MNPFFGSYPNSVRDGRKTMYLVLGALLTVLAHLRFGVGVLAWIAPIPFLRYLRVHRGWKPRAAVAATLAAAWIVACAKIITWPPLSR